LKRRLTPAALCGRPVRAAWLHFAVDLEVQQPVTGWSISRPGALRFEGVEQRIGLAAFLSSMLAEASEVRGGCRHRSAHGMVEGTPPGYPPPVAAAGITRLERAAVGHAGPAGRDRLDHHHRAAATCEGVSGRECWPSLSLRTGSRPHRGRACPRLGRDRDFDDQITAPRSCQRFFIDSCPGMPARDLDFLIGADPEPPFSAPGRSVSCHRSARHEARQASAGAGRPSEFASLLPSIHRTIQRALPSDAARVTAPAPRRRPTPKPIENCNRQVAGYITTSPTKNSPGALRACMVFESRPPVETPPR